MNSKKQKLLNISIPISLGELIDKITILEIKTLHMSDLKLENVMKEMHLLKNILQEKNLGIDVNLINNLKEINKNLWKIEDKIRQKELNQEFDQEFIQLARSVYKENDQRANIKKEINLKYNSELLEEKSYHDN